MNGYILLGGQVQICQFSGKDVLLGIYVNIAILQSYSVHGIIRGTFVHEYVSDDFVTSTRSRRLCLV